MKRGLRQCCFLLCAYLLLTALGGCATHKNELQNDKLQVVASVFAAYDFARQIAGDRAEVTLLLPAGTDSHYYEPTLADLTRINAADVLIFNGGEDEAWAQQITAQLTHADRQIVTMMQEVPLLHEPHAHAQEDGHDDHHGHEDSLDPHVWTSIANAKLICQAICKALCAADPAGSAEYEAALTRYLASLDAMDKQFSKLAKESGRTLVFADRFAFRYFANAYALPYLAAFDGCSGETEPTLETVVELTQAVKEQGLTAVFTAEFSTQAAANAIARQTDVQVLQLQSCHNVTREDAAANVTYLSLMQRNYECLKEAWGA